MRSNTVYKNIRLFLIVFTVSAFALGLISYAQGQQQTLPDPNIANAPPAAAEVTTTTTTTNPTNTPPQPQPVVTTTEGAGVAVGGAAGVIAIVKSVLDQRKNTKRDKTTDVDAGRFIILVSKLFQAMYLYPNMSVKEILDLPISNNPMSKMTLGQAITSEAELWANGNATYWGVPSPQMSVPTQTTVEAVKASTAAPATQPPPPANTPPAAKPTAQQPANTSIVGK